MLSHKHFYQTQMLWTEKQSMVRSQLGASWTGMAFGPLQAHPENPSQQNSGSNPLSLSHNNTDQNPESEAQLTYSLIPVIAVFSKRGHISGMISITLN